jgi:RNA polymerase sigma factor (sigma-70 family)
MSSAHVGIVLGYLRRLATVPKDEDLPDHQLLERFAARRDEAAFAALLRRHGPMVLGVCQSVLHNLHDAEDAFQATFLMLARKAGSIHRREAVSSWLHRVAYHLALKTHANAARRKLLEQRAATLPPADPVLDMSLRELRQVLNEELQQLPEVYRAPVVLCCLEEKSLEEAARLLGWSKWTVKGRLQRGRERLRARLRRRGLELSAGLLAIVLSARTVSAQVPAMLATVTLKAARWLAAGEALGTGIVSAEVAALVQGASKTMLTSQAKIATAWILVVGVAATALGAVLHQVSAANKPGPERASAAQGEQAAGRPAADGQARPADDAPVEVQGRILDPDGKPVAGAKLYLAYPTADEAHVEQRATSGNDGRFRFSVSRSDLARSESASERGHPQVLAGAPGYGPDWVALDGSGPVSGLTLRLVKDVPINGRILDPEGKPVGGAKLRVWFVSVPRGDDLGGYLEEAKKGYGYPFAKHWQGPLPGQPRVLTTGADGRFRLTGVGRERVVGFRVEGPAIATTALPPVMTRAAETLTDGKGRHIFGASFDYVAHASRPIRGVVRDKDTGKPLAGVTVGYYHGQGPAAVTDKEGRYELLGLAKSPHYSLIAKTADGLYFQRQVRFEDTPGLAALTADIDLVRGLTVRGRVTDRATGKPIAQARVVYYPLGGNTYVNAKVRGSWDPRSEAITGADGTYALAVFPGPGVIGVTAPVRDRYMPAVVTLKERKAFFKSVLVDDKDEEYLTRAAGGQAYGGISQADYNALVLLEPDEKDETLVRGVALERPQERKGRVVGLDGQPLTGVMVLGLAPYRYQVETLKGPDFTVRGINPRAKRALVFYHQEKNLGLFLKQLSGDTSRPLTVTLQPCGSASGRVVDPDGQPVAGLRLHVPGRALRWLGEDRWVTTDKEGRFRAVGLVPGQEYWVWDASGSFPRVFAQVVVEPGKNKDMGDITMTPRRQ